MNDCGDLGLGINLVNRIGREQQGRLICLTLRA